MLRKFSSLPIIFTVRTQSQGGHFADDNEEQLAELSLMAVKLGVEFLDVQLTSSASLVHKIIRNKGFTRFIAKFVDTKKELSWKNPEFDNKYNQAISLNADIVQLIGQVNCMSINKVK